MLIREMSKGECFRVLAGARLARLACAHDNQPYVVPVYLSYYAATGCLYGFTTLGQKIEWMRTNPLVCVEVDEMTAYNQWVSVIAMGSYEELTSTSVCNAVPRRPLEHSQHNVEALTARPVDNDPQACDDEREHAWQVLKTHPEWWEPSSTVWAARVHRDAAEPYSPIYYRIRIEDVTGHEAIPGLDGEIAKVHPTGNSGWFCRTVSRVFGGQG